MRFTGLHGLNAIAATAYDIDQKFGKEYSKRASKYIAYLQENDLTANIGMTDVKGNRSPRPIEQADPDLYLHGVDERKEGIKEGIIVRGAKAHQTGALNAHEIIVAPSTAEYNGVATVSHIREKITDMIHMNETMYACYLAASYEVIPTPSGVYAVNNLLSNT